MLFMIIHLKNRIMEPMQRQTDRQTETGYLGELKKLLHASEMGGGIFQAQLNMFASFHVVRRVGGSDHILSVEQGFQPLQKTKKNIQVAI